MTNLNPTDPSVSAEQLAQLAATDPASWDAILANPNCYPQLRDWIESQRGNNASAASEQESKPVQSESSEQPAADPLSAQPDNSSETAPQEPTGQMFAPRAPIDANAGQAPTMPGGPEGDPQQVRYAAPPYQYPDQVVPEKKGKSLGWLAWVVGAVVLVIALFLVLWLFKVPPFSASDGGSSDGGEKISTQELNEEEELTPEAFCALMEDSAMDIAASDINALGEVADVFIEGAKIAPSEIKSDMDLLAETMSIVKDFDIDDPASIDLGAASKIIENAEELDEAGTNVGDWITENCS